MPDCRRLEQHQRVGHARGSSVTACASSFDAVCTRDDVKAVKPAPDLFLLAAQRMGVAAGRCLVFEDSPNGLRAAHAAGMWAVAVPNALTRPLRCRRRTSSSRRWPT